jgi:hypothetical protein
VRRNLKYARRQDQAIRRDHQNVRPRSHEATENTLVFQILRLEYIEAATFGKPLDRALRGAQAASGRPVRLRQYQRDIMPGIKQRRQRARCELWSTGKN